VPFTDKQYEILINVTQEIMKRFPMINKKRIIGHSEIAPDRKTDPGPNFEWERYILNLNDMN
jgi:AmpD protein